MQREYKIFMGGDKMADGIGGENIDTSYMGKLNAGLVTLENVDDVSASGCNSKKCDGVH